MRSFARACLALLALAACRDRASAPTSAPDASVDVRARSLFPVTVRDDLGHEVTVKAEPHRIVSLLPSHTEDLFAVGAGDRVVGVDDNSDFPAEAARLPKLGSLYEPNVEQIVALAPDLVLTSEAGPAAERLASFGFPVWAGSGSHVGDVDRLLEVVGKLTGHGDAARAVETRLHGEVEAVTATLRGAPRVRFYYELDSTPYTVGPTSFLGALLDKAGGDNIIDAGLGEFPMISPELVIAKDPEVILGLTPRDASRRPGWSSITAVKRGRAELLTEAEQGIVSRPGPRIAQAIAVLARHLHGAGEVGADAGRP